jgi:type IV pilus assembly protein PilN
MAHINLLPWREELRQQRKQEYLTLLGVCAAAALVVFLGIRWHFKERIEYQQSRNAYVQQEIQRLDQKIKEIRELEKEKARLLARMKAIETLQTSRPVIVHVFDEMVNTLSDGIVVTSINQKNEKLTIQGRAQSNGSVSNYMRNIEASEWLTNPNLNVIQSRAGDGAKRNDFTLVMEQRDAEAAEAEDEGV